MKLVRGTLIILLTSMSNFIAIFDETKIFKKSIASANYKMAKITFSRWNFRYIFAHTKSIFYTVDT